MKKTLTKLALALSLATTLTVDAQTVVTFDSYTLTPNSYYQNNTGADFGQAETSFQYGWNTSFGGYWESGTAYTNVNDTVDGNYTNLYGSITGTAFNGNNYATAQNGAVVSFTNNTTALSGFYITNTTYAWKVIKSGNFASRKFGDTTGTGSGASIPQGEYPDWFKVLVRGYRAGTMLTDSVQFYLADYRVAGTANDYALKNWQFVNCISLGQVDSVKFEMKSSDVGSFGINTPTFFSLDNFTTVSTVGINELISTTNISLFPNPTSQNLSINFETPVSTELSTAIFDITGKEIKQYQIQTLVGKNQLTLQTEDLEAGVYFVEIKDGVSSKKLKFIKL